MFLQFLSVVSQQSCSTTGSVVSASLPKPPLLSRPCLPSRPRPTGHPHYPLLFSVIFIFLLEVLTFNLHVILSCLISLYAWNTCHFSKLLSIASKSMLQQLPPTSSSRTPHTSPSCELHISFFYCKVAILRKLSWVHILGTPSTRCAIITSMYSFFTVVQKQLQVSRPLSLMDWGL